MVKKILKYDLQGYVRTLLPAAFVLLGAAILNRVIQFFENSGTVYGILFGSSVVVIVLSICFVSLFTLIIIVTRFYKGLFGREAYLTLTLPVTANEQVIAKLIGACIVTICTWICIILSLMIATSGDMLTEIIKAGNYLVKKYFAEFSVGGAILLVVETIVEFFVLSIATPVLFYFCATVGQLAKKKRILAAVGIYFAIYFITQVFGTILVILGALDLEWVTDLILWLTDNVQRGSLVGLGGILLFQLIISGVFYFVIRHIFNKKLDLE